eukprot:UN11478
MRGTISNIDPLVSLEAATSVNLITNVITKHSVLFGFAILVNQGFFISQMITNFLKINDSLINQCMNYMLRGLENVTNVLVLWLVLRINYDEYICFCKYCHFCVTRCCFKQIDTDTAINPYRRLERITIQRHTHTLI